MNFDMEVSKNVILILVSGILLYLLIDFLGRMAMHFNIVSEDDVEDPLNHLKDKADDDAAHAFVDSLRTGNESFTD